MMENFFSFEYFLFRWLNTKFIKRKNNDVIGGFQWQRRRKLRRRPRRRSQRRRQRRRSADRGTSSGSDFGFQQISSWKGSGGFLKGPHSFFFCDF
jgi:hypothetical protein